jgi:hypothetical protein
MTVKIRRVDLYADEFLAAIAGEMTAAELGVYWLVNLLCYSRRGMIDRDLTWIRAKLRPHKSNKDIGRIIERLIETGRLVAEGAQIGCRRAVEEVERATCRVEEAAKNGRKGGRPPKHINGFDKPGGLFSEKLTNNYQPPTNASPNGDASPPCECPPKEKPHERRGTRLASDWTPDFEDRQYARDRGFDPDDTAAGFRDFWTAKAGPNARKIDWHAAWRYWVRNEPTRRPAQSAGGQRPGDDRRGPASDLRAAARAAARFG